MTARYVANELGVVLGDVAAAFAGISLRITELMTEEIHASSLALLSQQMRTFGSELEEVLGAAFEGRLKRIGMMANPPAPGVMAVAVPPPAEATDDRQTDAGRHRVPASRGREEPPE